MIKWERIDDYTQRTRVFGGWLVHSIEPVMHSDPFNQGQGMVDGWDYRPAMAFVPDFFRLWRLPK